MDKELLGIFKRSWFNQTEEERNLDWQEHSWVLTEKEKQIYIPLMQKILAEIDNGIEDGASFNLSKTALNPNSLRELLVDVFNYEYNDDYESNGWQMDFGETYSKKGHKSLAVSGTGYTFELYISEDSD